MTSRTSPPATLAHSMSKLARDLDALAWHTPSHVYNPLQYAWDGYRQYLERFGNKRGRVLLLGMNPGPWGMAQTGVPFGNITSVRDWFRIETKLADELPEQHPKYPILGMGCPRDEGSGKRLWGWARERVGTPEQFFEHFFVWNYCPLLFLANGRNLIPSGLKASEQQALDALCTKALEDGLALLQPTAVVAFGRYAEARARELVGDDLPVHYLLHPSPANPSANKHWVAHAEQTLGAWLPGRR